LSDHVQRWLSIVLGAAVVVLMGWLTLNQSDRRPRAEPDAGLAPATQSDAGAEPASAAPQAKNDKPDLDAGGDRSGLSLFFLDAGTMMPTGAPRAVKLGVVLVQYAGAEGASSNVRSKREALGVAERLAEQAKTDWKGAVKSGDSGSAEDIGRIPRGVLDPATEVAVFSLGAGDVSGVLDTPRGYWIVKRAE
jgi:PPIC-type PPIASE domain